MRPLTALFTFVALLAAASWTPPASSASGVNVKVATPLLRADASLATGQGSVAIAAKGTKASVTFSVANLPVSVAPPLGVFLEEGVSAGTFAEVASIAALSAGAGKVVVASVNGDPPLPGVADLAALVGRKVEVRNSGGTTLLEGKIPSYEKPYVVKFAAKLEASDGSPGVSAKVSGALTAKTGAEKLLLKAKGLTDGVAYALFIEDAPGSGVFVAAGDLDGDSFLRDEAVGDVLPIGIASLEDLVGRGMEVRKADGTPVSHGSFPRFGLAIAWPQHHVVLLDEGMDPTYRFIRYSPGLVLYRPEFDIKKTSIGVLRKDSNAYWRTDLVGAVPNGLIVTFRLEDDDRFWWAANNSGGDHYLGVHNGSGPPSNQSQVRFILHRLDKKEFGKNAYTIESELYPGEYVINQGHSLTGNGVRIGPGVPPPFLLR